MFCSFKNHVILIFSSSYKMFGFISGVALSPDKREYRCPNPVSGMVVTWHENCARAEDSTFSPQWNDGGKESLSLAMEKKDLRRVRNAELCCMMMTGFLKFCSSLGLWEIAKHIQIGLWGFLFLLPLPPERFNFSCIGS